MTKKKEKKRTKNFDGNQYLEIGLDQRLVPRTDEWLSRLAEVLRYHVDTEDCISLKSFFCKYNVSRTRFSEDWVDRSQDLKEAYEYAIEKIADRREYGAATRKYDPATIYRAQAQYDRDYKANILWLNQLKQQDEINKTIRIILDQVPYTAEVTADIERKKS